MTWTRRGVIGGLSGACLAPAVLAPAVLAPAVRAAEDAAAYPSRPVRIVVGYQAGGPTDLTARAVGDKLQAFLGQPFVVENRPGAGSNLASTQVAASDPDGYTLMVTASPFTWAKAVYKNLRFDPITSFVPVSEIMAVPQVLAVRPGLAVASLAELVELLRKNPGRITCATTGLASTPHVSIEMLQEKTGTRTVHVAYRGGGAVLTDMLGDRVDMAFMTALSTTPFFQSGALRALAVTSAHRVPQLPDVPTTAEAGVQGVEIESWNGLFAPAGTPAGIVDKLYGGVSKALALPDVRKTFEDQVATVIGSSPRDFAALVAHEVEERTRFVRSIGLKLD